MLSGGEIPALIIVDAITRLLPGVLGNVDSLVEETFENDSLRQLTAASSTRNTQDLMFLINGRSPISFFRVIIKRLPNGNLKIQKALPVSKNPS